MDESHDGEKSAYNSAVQFMFELSGIRKQLHQARWEANTELRYDTLVSYYMALSSRMNGSKLKPMQTKHDQYYNEISKELSIYIKGKKRNRRISGRIFGMLDKWEQDLRKDEDYLGLLVPSKSDPAFALGGQTF